MVHFGYDQAANRRYGRILVRRETGKSRDKRRRRDTFKHRPRNVHLARPLNLLGLRKQSPGELERLLSRLRLCSRISQAGTVLGALDGFEGKPRPSILGAPLSMWNNYVYAWTLTHMDGEMLETHQRHCGFRS